MDAHLRGLLQRVWMDPDDVGAASRYAQALCERGDPRGTYVRLSMTGRDPERASRLLRRHRREWLGDCLADVLLRECFDGGFLRAVALRRDVTVESVAAISRSPELRTVQRLRQGFAPLDAYRALVESPMLTGLRDLYLPTTCLGSGEIPFVAPIETLWLTTQPTGVALDLLMQDPHFADLRKLGLRNYPGGSAERIVRCATQLPLTHLALPGEPARLLPALFDTGLRRLRVGGWSLSQDGIRVLEVHRIPSEHEIMSTIDPLRHGLDRIELWATTDAETMERTASRLRDAAGDVPVVVRCPDLAEREPLWWIS